MARLTPRDRPRLLVTDDDFERAAALVGEDEFATACFENVRERGETLLETPPVSYEIPDGLRLLAVSREVKERSLALAGLYRLTGEDRYADRLYEEFEAVAAFPDWNPRHFLDTAEMTAAVAVGYDWCHDYWRPTQRAQLRDAIYDHALSEALPGYRGVDDEIPDGGDRPKTWWLDCEHNWSSVCNGGMTMGALALLGDDDRTSHLEEVIDGARESIERAVAELSPNGGWAEGAGYFRYNTEYLAFYLTSIASGLGTDFGYHSYPGMANVGDFPLFLTAPNGEPFNFGDAHKDSRIDAPSLFWFARTFDRPEWAGYQRRGVGDDGGIRDLLWYDPATVADPETAELPLDAYFPGAEETVTMRAAWDDPEAPFVGFKGGDNQVNHGDLDLGTFVFDASGVRWAVDLGTNDYNVPDYWDSSVDGGRWRYYRKRAEGHNLPVLAPDEGPDQHPFATAAVERVHGGKSSAYAVADLSAAYAGATVRRGVALADGRSRIVVRDEIDATKPVDGWWFLHTGSDVTVDGRTATLAQDGASVTVHLVSPADATFELRDAEALPSSPRPAEEAPVEDVRKLAVHLNDVTSTAVSIHVGDGIAPPESAPIPLADWSRESLAAFE